MKSRFAFLILCSFSALSALEAANSIVNLNLRERIGFSRVDEPVTVGVPLPKGLVQDISELSLIGDAGMPVPAHFKVANRWREDGSVKWIHIHFQYSVPAFGSRTLNLVQRQATAASVSRLSVTDNPDEITVITGPLKFIVRKANFNGLSEVWWHGANSSEFTDSDRVVGFHDRGLLMTTGDRDYWSSSDSNSSVIVEEVTPMYVTLKATGRLKQQSGARGFSFICRLTAYRDLARVAAQVTVINDLGPRREDFVPLEQFAWEIPTVFSSPIARIGGESQIHSSRLTVGDSAHIYQSSSDTYSIGGVLKGSGSGKTTKPYSTGWAGLETEAQGLAVGVRWFWQTFPKAIEVDGGGKVSVQLYPSQHQPLDIYNGVSRTHNILFLFHGTEMKPEDQRDVMAAFQKPLHPMAPLRWYTRDTQAFPNLVEAEPALFGSEWETVRTYLDWWGANFSNIVRKRDGRAFRGINRDAYGWLDFGDGLHWAWQLGNSDPRNLAWDGNYYDFPHVCLLHFLQTGSWELFDFFVEHSHHLADVHFVHHDPQPIFIGANRYCPPTDHVRLDPSDPSDYRTARVYVSDTFNHHKTQSLFEKYLLTADPRALDVALLGLKYAFDYGAADNAYNQPRGPGHQLLTLLAGYEFTGDRKYLDRCQPVVNFGKKAQAANSGGFNNDSSSFFQFGIAMEGLRSYYEATEDESIIQMIRDAMDFLIARDSLYSNTAHACGFLYDHTGDRSYLDRGTGLVKGSRVFSNPVKDTALNLRNVPYFLFYLKSDDSAGPDLIFPQYVNGETAAVPNITRFVIRNSGNEVERGKILFRDSQGNLQFLPVNGENVSMIEFMLHPWGTIDVQTDGTGPLVAGYVEVVAEEAGAKWVGNEVFEVLGYSVSVEDSPPRSTHQVYISVTGKENSGIAVVNTNKDEEVILDLILADENGDEVDRQVLELFPGQQVAKYVDDADLMGEYFGTIAGEFRGTLNVSVREGKKTSLIGLLQDRASGALIAVGASARVFDKGTGK